MRIRTLDRLQDVHSLDGLLEEYIRFVTGDLERAFGVTFDPEVLLENTLSSLDKVVPPKGHTFVAEDEAGEILGMAFLRPSGTDAMEIKRLYVPPSGRGRGVGRALVEAAMDAARQAGAIALRLDSSRNLETAIALYQSLGFVERAPYPESDHFEDPILGPYLIFMERRLDKE